MSQETDSQGNSLQYSYNGLGELTTEIATSSTGTVARTQLSYNSNGQVTQIQDFTVASAGTAVLTINDSYDVNGNLTTEIETGSGVSVTYVNSYDADNRITSEVRNGVTTPFAYNAESQVTTDGQSNSYDANGNLTNSGFSIGIYNEVVSSNGSAGTWSYYYDGVGNVVEAINQATSVTWNYSYDFDFRLLSAIEHNAGGTLIASGTYAYDNFGDLVAETITSGGSTTVSKYAYNGSQIYADMNSGGTITTVYDSGAGNGALYGRIQSGTIYWVGQDRQGSVRDIFNAAGSSELDAVTYESDGQIQSQTNATYLGNYAYTGFRVDSLTAFYVALDRWYNTATVQWLQLDPIGVQGGLSNFRSYVGDDWTNDTDLSGDWVYTDAAGVQPWSGWLSQFSPSFPDVGSGYNLVNVPVSQRQALGQYFVSNYSLSPPDQYRVDQAAQGPAYSLFLNADGTISLQNYAGQAFVTNATNIDRVQLGEAPKSMQVFTPTPFTPSNAAVAAAQGAADGAVVIGNELTYQQINGLNQAAQQKIQENPSLVNSQVCGVVARECLSTAIGAKAIGAASNQAGNALSKGLQKVASPGVACTVKTVAQTGGALYLTADQAIQAAAAATAAYDAIQSNASPTEIAAKLTQAGINIASLGYSVADLASMAKQLGQEGFVKFFSKCFAAGTQVLTDRGWVAIETIRQGDRVWSRSDKGPDNPGSFREVGYTLERFGAIMELHVGGQVLRTTAEHPFWVRGRGWTATESLRSGDELAGKDGE